MSKLNFNNLNKTLKGKNNYYFLVNDVNSEIKQHYDDVKPLTNFDKFKLSQKSKKEYLESLGINYDMFVVPDKSILLRKYLPFETKEPVRCLDSLNDYLYDLLEILDEDDTIPTDTHTSRLSSLKVVPYVLSKLNDKSPEYYRKAIENKVEIEEYMHKGDLFFKRNWSYPSEEETRKKYLFIKLDKVVLKDDYTKVDIKEIPKEFRQFTNRKSRYFINNNSISDERAVIFHGSSALNMIPAFMAYYREVFFYWNYNYFSKEIIDWFKPDVVIDFFVERVFYNLLCPIVSKDTEVVIPIDLIKKEINIKDNLLEIRLEGRDLRNLKIKSTCKFYLSGEYIGSSKFVDGKCEYEYDISNYSKGIYDLKIFVEETHDFKHKIEHILIEIE